MPFPLPCASSAPERAESDAFWVVDFESPKTRHQKVSSIGVFLAKTVMNEMNCEERTTSGWTMGDGDRQPLGQFTVQDPYQGSSLD